MSGQLTLFILIFSVNKIHHIQSNYFFPQVLQSTQIKTMEGCLYGLHITVSQMPNVSFLKLNVNVSRSLSPNSKCDLYLFLGLLDSHKTVLSLFLLLFLFFFNGGCYIRMFFLLEDSGLIIPICVRPMKNEKPRI